MGKKTSKTNERVSKIQKALVKINTKRITSKHYRQKNTSNNILRVLDIINTLLRRGYLQVVYNYTFPSFLNPSCQYIVEGHVNLQVVYGDIDHSLKMLKAEIWLCMIRKIHYDRSRRVRYRKYYKKSRKIIWNVVA